jgi:hypothetical protein
VVRVPDGAARAEGIAPRDLPAGREIEERWIDEHGLVFPVLAAGGHKTAGSATSATIAFESAPRARALRAGPLLQRGGFALSCARSGARSVRAVDLDEKALERAQRAGGANQLQVDWVHADSFDVLRSVTAERARTSDPSRDLRPHKLIPSRAQLEAGRRKYLDLYTLALRRRAGRDPRGFSCSGSLGSRPSRDALRRRAPRRALRAPPEPPGSRSRSSSATGLAALALPQGRRPGAGSLTIRGGRDTRTRPARCRRSSSAASCSVLNRTMEPPPWP